MPTAKDGTYFDVYIGIIANHFLNILSTASEVGSHDELSNLDALGEHFIRELEMAMTGQFPGMSYLDKTIAIAKYESVCQAAEKYHFPLTLENLSRLKTICYQAAQARRISSEDYNYLERFLGCIQSFSYFIAPAVKLPQPVKSG